MKEPTYKLWLAGGVFLCCLATTSLSQAQIVGDRTVSTKVTTSDNLNFTIIGGSRAGGNLFHSFNKFSVPNKGLALFNNASNVQNIISRVTGGSISNIDGLIRARGSANLFLLNPNGIIFGPDAQLDIGGSFLASTADRLNFADDRFFNATDPQAQPLLSVRVPTGLQFGETTGRIVNQSQATRFFPEFGIEAPVGLEVQPGRTLALVGGDIFLETGRMLASEGRIELGSVAGSDLVSLTPIPAGWALGYEAVRNFQDIQLSQDAFVNTGGERLGDIQLHGRRISITDGSYVGGANFGTGSRGTFVVTASESVELSRGSSLNTTTLSSGASGDITISTRRLVVRDGSFIDTASNSDGRSGDLIVNASESVEVNGGGELSQLSTQAIEDGDAGKLRMTTGRLILQDGGQISSSTRDAGDGGSVFVDASKSVEASGQGETFSGRVVKSGLFAESQGSKPAGDLIINTGDLVVRDGAAVSVSSQGLEKAGSLKVVARSILLDNQGDLTAETTTSGMGGDITLQARDVRLQRESNISTTAGTEGGPGDGGNITINTDTLVGLGNSDITANAFEGKGGFIQITSQGIFGLKVREPNENTSDISAVSQEDPDLNGVVEINTPDVDPSEGVIDLPEKVVDVSGLVAQSCPAGGSAVARGRGDKSSGQAPPTRIARTEFVVTGRGGLPPTPSEALKSDTVLVDLGTPMVSSTKPSPASKGQLPAMSGQAAPEEPLRRARGHTEDSANSAVSNNLTHSAAAPIVEAQGWVRSPNGQVVLTAQAPTVAPHRSGLTSATCHGF